MSKRRPIRTHKSFLLFDHEFVNEKKHKVMKEENETTIGEFVKGKRKLEKDIGALLLEFEERYGVEARSYIAKAERGDTDLRLSSFLRIAKALRIEFNPVFF